MKRNKSFNSVLDECLERLLRGETIEQCLQSYPESASALEPLLRTALMTTKAFSLQPRPEFRARARLQFQAALREAESKKARRAFNWQLRWATVGAVALVIMVLGGGTVAAGNSMPGQSLYPVKLATEQAQLTLTPSALGKAELYARLADRRVEEIVYLASKGDTERVEETAQRLNAHLTNVAHLAGVEKKRAAALSAPAPAMPPAPLAGQAGKDTKAVPPQPDRREKIRKMVKDYALDHPARLRAALKTAPESVKTALSHSIDISETDYEGILQAMDAGGK